MQSGSFSSTHRQLLTPGGGASAVTLGLGAEEGAENCEAGVTPRRPSLLGTPHGGGSRLGSQVSFPPS